MISLWLYHFIVFPKSKGFLLFKTYHIFLKRVKNIPSFLLPLEVTILIHCTRKAEDEINYSPTPLQCKWVHVLESKCLLQFLTFLTEVNYGSSPLGQPRIIPKERDCNYFESSCFCHGSTYSFLLAHRHTPEFHSYIWGRTISWKSGSSETLTSSRCLRQESGTLVMLVICAVTLRQSCWWCWK